MRTAWISLNLAGLALIIGGAVYTLTHKTGVPFVMIGMVLMSMSLFFRARVYRNK